MLVPILSEKKKKKNRRPSSTVVNAAIRINLDAVKSINLPRTAKTLSSYAFNNQNMHDFILNENVRF